MSDRQERWKREGGKGSSVAWSQGGLLGCKGLS